MDRASLTEFMEGEPVGGSRQIYDTALSARCTFVDRKQDDGHAGPKLRLKACCQLKCVLTVDHQSINWFAAIFLAEEVCYMLIISRAVKAGEIQLFCVDINR